MVKKFLRLNDIGAYKIAFNLSNYVWSIVVKRDYFTKDTVGKQFARSVDSISANADAVDKIRLVVAEEEKKAKKGK